MKLLPHAAGSAPGGKLLVPCIDANVVVTVDPETMRVLATQKTGPGPIVVLPAAGGRYWLSHSTGTSIWRF